MNTQPNQQGDTSPEDDLSGRQLGDYRVLRRLGRGAMAVVYLAEQCSLNRQVAFKVLRDDLVDDHVYVQRFAREAKAAAALVHANIVQIYEVGCVDRVHFIAQEYVEGQNLRDWISRHDRPDLPHILSIMSQVGAALAKAGSRGVIHRDIKPENILLTRSGEVKVADFGLARLSNQGDPVELTQVGITLGTPLYMSPEQVEGKPLDPRSDMYSFGVTCFHMIAGSPPFTGETPLSVAVQHLKKEPERLEHLRSDLSRPLCEIVHRMLAKDPKQRYQSATNFLQDLRQFQQEHFGNQWPDSLPAWSTTHVDDDSFGPVQATQRLQAVMDTTAMPTRQGRHLAVFVGVAVVMLFLGATAAWFLMQTKSLISPTQVNNTVSIEKNILLQYLQATRLNTPEHWQAVIDFKDADKSYVHRAKQQLIRLYLADKNDDRVLPLCDELISLDPNNEAEFRAFGYAGRAIALCDKGEYAESAKAYAALQNLSDHFHDPIFQERLKAVEQKNSKALESASALPK